MFNKDNNDLFIDNLINNYQTKKWLTDFENKINKFSTRGYKKWVTIWDNKVSQSCKYNEMLWFIPINEYFIDWKFNPPWHKNCRCFLDLKTEVEIDFDIKKYILKREEISKLIESDKLEKERKNWKNVRNSENWYNNDWLKSWEALWWESRNLKAIKRVKDYVYLKYWENADYMLSIIYEEQSHLIPWENLYESIDIDLILADSRWLSQIRYDAPKSDEEYFWYEDNSIEDVLDEYKHLKIMNNRINKIKSKLKDEWLEITTENIWRAWNWWKSWMLSPDLNVHANNYWKRISLYYRNLDKIKKDADKTDESGKPLTFEEQKSAIRIATEKTSKYINKKVDDIWDWVNAIKKDLSKKYSDIEKEFIKNFNPKAYEKYFK